MVQDLSDIGLNSSLQTKVLTTKNYQPKYCKMQLPKQSLGIKTIKFMTILLAATFVILASFKGGAQVSETAQFNSSALNMSVSVRVLGLTPTHKALDLFPSKRPQVPSAE
jgi:hypothetical protein